MVKLKGTHQRGEDRKGKAGQSGSILMCYLFIWGFTSLSTLYRSYHDRYLEGQRKPVHTVCQGSVL